MLSDRELFHWPIVTDEEVEAVAAVMRDGAAPSGTAIVLANDIAAISGSTPPIESHRVGEVPGIHTIRYDSDADLITITHDAHSRKGFALGAVLAAEYTKEHQGLLTISDMFKF